MVSFERVLEVAQKFVQWRDKQGLAEFGVDIFTGYCCDSPLAFQAQQFNRKAGATSWQYLPVNGMEFRSERELRQLLLSWKENGVTSIGVTFYGLRKFHDYWSNRPGDFDYTLLIAKTAADLGLHRQETIFLSKDGIGDIPDLIDLLDSIPGKKSRSICPWDYRGRGKKLEEERVLISQVEALPEHMRKCINPRYLSEADWIREIEAGNAPRKNRRYYLISLWEDNIAQLESTDSGEILQQMRDEDERLYQAIPSLSTLAQLYGQMNGKKVYWLRDLEWKWIDLYLTAHPEIDQAGRFNDLDSIVLWH